jgi:hypothetical protein
MNLADKVMRIDLPPDQPTQVEDRRVRWRKACPSIPAAGHEGKSKAKETQKLGWTMTTDDSQVNVRKDASEELRTAADLAAAGAAAVGRRRTEEMAAAQESQKAVFRAMLDDARVAEPSESDLRESQRVRVALRESMEACRRYIPGGEPVSLRLHEHTELKFPQYDTEWRWGNAETLISDQIDGHIQIEGDSWHSNPINSACGVGVSIKSDVNAMAQVRPYVQYKWNYDVTSDYKLSNATCTGGLDLSAWQGSTIASSVTRDQLFHKRVSVGEHEGLNGDGAVFPPDYNINFFMAAGVEYVINIGAWVECEHARGFTSVSFAQARGFIDAYVRWVTIERFI